jgi:hypothetical protein
MIWQGHSVFFDSTRFRFGIVILYASPPPPVTWRPHLKRCFIVQNVPLAQLLDLQNSIEWEISSA